MSKITVTGQLTLTGGQLTAKETYVAPVPPAGPTNGELWSWGVGSPFGRHGLGDTVNRSSPSQVGALTTWTNISAGRQHGHAIKTDGTLWGWGRNDLSGSGAVGDGTAINKSSPIQIGSLTDWSKVNANRHTLAVKTDGTLWGWGENDSGELGQGNTTDRSSPVQIGALTDWADIAPGDKFSLGIKTNGELWAWGYNTGTTRLGLGDAVNRSSPSQVGALTNWSSIVAGNQHTVAIKTDGTLWSWGDGGYGRAGHGNVTSYSSPVQVGALSDWSSAFAGGSHTVALKTNGTLWTWGRNNQGQLGHNDIINRSSPVQVGALTTWASIAIGTNSAHAIKTDGTLWGIGGNGIYLGDGTAIVRSSPVQIGSDTNWSQIDSHYHSHAIKTV